ncbi:hypothetical protein P2318_09565 [Myxococcaceae bacterium GXIMD 01537]
MSQDKRLYPLELMRQLTLSIERLLAQGLASGAVHGATQELQAGLPEMDEPLRALFQDVLTLVGRLAHDAASRPAYPPGTWPRVIAESAMHGIMMEFRNSHPDLHITTEEIFKRLRDWLERSTEHEQQRLEEGRAPGFRARDAAAGAVEGVVAQLDKSRERLAPMAAEVASQAGRGFVEGLGAKTDEQTEALTRFLERAGHVVVHTLAEALETELRARKGQLFEDVGAAVAQLAERTAEATVRGAFAELARHQEEQHLQRAGWEVSSGALAAAGARLRRPLALAAGAGGALFLAALIVLRTR